MGMIFYFWMQRYAISMLFTSPDFGRLLSTRQNLPGVMLSLKTTYPRNHPHVCHFIFIDIKLSINNDLSNMHSCKHLFFWSGVFRCLLLKCYVGKCSEVSNSWRVFIINIKYNINIIISIVEGGVIRRTFRIKRTF